MTEEVTVQMSPVPDENYDNRDDHPSSDDLESPEFFSHPGGASTSDEEEIVDDDNNGYVLLPQELEDDDSEVDTSSDHLSPSESTPINNEGTVSGTEFRGPCIDMSESLAQGIVHPAFLTNFPDNKVPNYMQVPNPPRTKKDEALWNQPQQEQNSFCMDSVQVSKVKSAMAGFQLPSSNIPEWANNVSDEQWKTLLATKLNYLGPGQQGMNSNSTN